jgi:predicted RNase H-like HicB family nuclease
LVIDVAVVLTAIVRPEPDAGGYSASIPALPGCHTQDETLDEVRANLREAPREPREGNLREADVPRS